jgi:hypothetical protein
MAQDQSAQQQSAQQRSAASIIALDALQDCLKKSKTEEILECVVRAKLKIKPLHFYTGEYTRFSEVDFGPRYDPSDNPPARAAADMCKRFAPEIKDPVSDYSSRGFRRRGLPSAF